MRIGGLCALATLCACSFDPGGVPPDDGGAGDASRQDASGPGELGTGKDGELIVEGTLEINEYAAIESDVAAGDTRVPLAEDALDRFAPGDLVLLHHSAGLAASATPSGDATPIDAAAAGIGEYQLVRVASVGSEALHLEAPTTAAFPAVASQVVRVPELTSLVVPAGGTVTAMGWNGRRGGIVAVLVTGAARIDGAIDVAGDGFHGGVAESVSTLTGCSALDGTSAEGGGGAKGEGLVVGGATHGRGNLGHAAGGGDCSNAGGGGGGGAGAGGVGGGTYQANEAVGGLGGAAVVLDPATHLVFGGGGGAGEDNNDGAPGGNGGNGGGVVLIRARAITGAGALRASGTDGTGSTKDGAGGGGGGGAIVVVAQSSLALDDIAARGGRGGDSSESGAGGGGGGGWIAVQTGLLATPLHVEAGGGGTNVNDGTSGAAGVTTID